MEMNLQHLRLKGNHIRANYIESMENHLLALESNLQNKGIPSYWVMNETDLLEQLKTILPSNETHRICIDAECVSTQLIGDERKLKVVKLNNPNANVLMVQADYAIVDKGALVFIDKKSQNLFNHFSNIIVILNISDLIVKAKDLDILNYLKYYGKATPTDYKFLTAPFDVIKPHSPYAFGEQKPEEEKANISLILYDNGISSILEDPILREALYCINCGKCAQVCPVYRINNEQSPIQLVKNNCDETHRKSGTIFESTSLCGSCSTECPVKIPICDLLIMQMEMEKNRHRESATSRYRFLTKRVKMNKLNAVFPNLSFFNRALFLRKKFGKNKKLFHYFREQKKTFYNIQQNNEE